MIVILIKIDKDSEGFTSCHMQGLPVGTYNEAQSKLATHITSAVRAAIDDLGPAATVVYERDEPRQFAE